MLNLTKIFRFEMAHAIHGYQGVCKNIHGHSYELHVTIGSSAAYADYIPAPGILVDFKEIKKRVNTAIIEMLDHKMILSHDFLARFPALSSQENLVIWEAEPTAENMLLYIKRILSDELPDGINLVRLKLYETKDSYAEWTC